MNYRVSGGKTLSGSVQTNISKNAAVALLAASLLNRGETVLKRMPRIQEVNRLIEVMESIGVKIIWEESGDIRITPPEKFDLSKINQESAGRTRSIALFIAPLAHVLGSFDLPAPTGCDLGKRSLGAHIDALAKLGIEISGNEDTHTYHVEVRERKAATIVMYEASDTGVENVLMAAAKIPGTTTIKFASANYMVQDLCFFLERCGVQIEGIGTSTLTVHGTEYIDEFIEGHPSEDPIESMFFIALAATTKSEITIERCPMDFLELELYTLGQMGLRYDIGERYTSHNGKTILADVTIHPSELVAAPEKIAPRPYPGINIDNLPFFVPVATQATGKTLIHDWVYDGRAKHYMLMEKLGAKMELLDPHRVLVEGPTKLCAADVEAPPALRPATLLLIGMLAAEGESMLRNVYPINRGYANLAERLTRLGASIEAVE
ncbi:MAG: UDP-N-acetylglucosamine 1-carboxyvinyltransferase [Parcubacteria group bacterium Athens0416_74]|nr:MAG: UDP-N-acetylglucosamine 1-carboxyvinyltransferase [Parcubacteria group bacterium Athens0416_74]